MLSINKTLAMSEMTEIVDSGPTDDRGANYTVDDDSKINGFTSTEAGSTSFSDESQKIQQGISKMTSEQNPEPMLIQSDQVQSVVDSSLMKEKEKIKIRKTAVVKAISKKAVKIASRGRKRDSRDVFTMTLRSRITSLASLVEYSTTERKQEAVRNKTWMPPKLGLSPSASNRKENGGNSSTRILRSSSRCADLLTEETAIPSKPEAVTGKSFTPPGACALSDNKRKKVSTSSRGSNKSVKCAAPNAKSLSTLANTAALRDDNDSDHEMPNIELPKDEIKCILAMWELICHHEHSHLFLVPPDEVSPEAIQRSIDLNTLKKDINAGAINTVKRFETCVYYMFFTAMLMETESSVRNHIHEMERDSYKNLKKFKRVLNITKEADSEDDYVNPSNRVPDVEYDNDDTADGL